MNAVRHLACLAAVSLLVACSSGGGSPADAGDGGDGSFTDSPTSPDGGPACGGNSAGIVDPMRAIDWSPSGVGGIPSRTAICATLDAATYGNGSSDATAAIQAALDACPADQTVALSAGKFLINSSVSVPARVTLRGAGADQTILNAKGSKKGVVTLGASSPTSSAVDITGGATRGSTSITVSAANGISVGGYLLVSELNDPAYVSIHGGEGDCTWCDVFWNGTRARSQIVEVTSVSGTTIGVSPGLYSDYALTPQAAPFSATKYAGVEDLQVYANQTGYTSSFYMSGCAYCWVKGVESNYTDGDYVQVHFGFRDEIRDSYFSNAYNHTPGTTDSDVFIASKTTATLVENNIIERGHVAIMLNWGAAGNVIAYNYTHGEFDQNATNVVIGGISMHGAHPQFNLMEGNVVTEIGPDEIWGSSSHNTAFRNWTTGTTKLCSPTTGRGTIDCSGANGHFTFQASRAMHIGSQSTSMNFVGNVVGSAEQSSLLAYGTNPVTVVALLTYPSPRIYDSTVYNWTFGYGETSDDGSGTGCAGSLAPPCHSTKAFDSAFLHGNYSHADGSITWDSATTHALPCSMYLSSQPAWWTQGMPFPATGPEIAGGAGPAGHSYGNPAKACYESKMGGAIGGAGGPLVFNAKACFGG